jgi:hypothetical protein
MAGHLAISIEWQLEFPGPAWPLFHRERRQSLRAACSQPRALFQLLCLYQANPTTSASWEDPCACAWGTAGWGENGSAEPRSWPEGWGPELGAPEILGFFCGIKKTVRGGRQSWSCLHCWGRGETGEFLSGSSKNDTVPGASVAEAACEQGHGFWPSLAKARGG